MNTDTDLRIAVLIDADNISDKYIEVILEEVANAGTATYKRIYGDWTSPRLSRWKKCLLDNSIIPMQQYSYTFGKNSTDSAMIIDAMDILYSGTVDGFAIVSSDSDFTRLVARLRESGMVVIGMGEQKTPRPFISACNSFKYLDLLLAAREEDEEDAADEDEGGAEGASSRRRRGRRGGRRAARARGAGDAGSSTVDAADADGAVDAEPDIEGEDEQDAGPRRRRRPGDRGQVLSDEPDAPADEAEEDAEGAELEFGEMSKADRRRHMRMIRGTINAIVDKFSDDDGWVGLGQLGDQLSRRLPDFDVRNYGFKKLRPFLKSLGVYELQEPDGSSGNRQPYLRIRVDEAGTADGVR